MRLGLLVTSWLVLTLLLSPGRSWHRFSGFFVVVKDYVRGNPAPPPVREIEADADQAQDQVQASGTLG